MYLISIPDSIERILKTRLGSRAMRPMYGSRLYLLRDRKFNDQWKLLATRYVYEALSRNEPRVAIERVTFELHPVTGVITIKVHLNNGEIVEVNND